MEDDKYIEISGQLLGKGVSKLNVLHFDDEVLALEKPAGVVIDAHPWYEGIPSIVRALKKQASKPEVAEYHLENPFSIYILEPEVTGVALIATGKEATEFLRNEFGSGKLNFHFQLLAKSNLTGDPIECDLPLAKHYNQNTMIVSKKTGKKSKTSFSLISQVGDYQLWEAKTDYLRMHQIRVHAMERGIRIIGENIYIESESPRSIAYKGKNKDREDVIEKEGCLCLHLARVEWEKEGKRIVVESSLPHRITDFLGKDEDRIYNK